MEGVIIIIALTVEVNPLVRRDAPAVLRFFLFFSFSQLAIILYYIFSFLLNYLPCFSHQFSAHKGDEEKTKKRGGLGAQETLTFDVTKR